MKNKFNKDFNSDLQYVSYQSGSDSEYPHCPICGEECEDIYRNKYFEIVGCNECIARKDAWEVEECFPQTRPYN